MNKLFGVIAGCAAAAAAVLLPPAPIRGIAGPATMRGGNSGWVLVDFDSFSCGLCLEALVGFTRAIPQVIQETCLRGVLVRRSRARGEEGARETAILAKKWAGFRKANDVRFPIFIDDSRFFANDLALGSTVLVFDEGAGTLRAYPLPLRPCQVEEILAVLRK
jgi:hypothetical protein